MTHVKGAPSVDSKTLGYRIRRVLGRFPPRKGWDRAIVLSGAARALLERDLDRAATFAGIGISVSRPFWEYTDAVVAGVLSGVRGRPWLVEGRDFRLEKIHLTNCPECNRTRAAQQAGDFGVCCLAYRLTG